MLPPLTSFPAQHLLSRGRVVSQIEAMTFAVTEVVLGARAAAVPTRVRRHVVIRAAGVGEWLLGVGCLPRGVTYGGCVSKTQSESISLWDSLMFGRLYLYVNR